MEHARLSIRHQQAMLGLMTSFIQTCHTMLYVANTTQIEGARERCISKARHICHRLSSWVARHPEMGELRDSLEDLIRRLPR